MYRLKLKGFKDIVVTDRQYRQLLRRFDIGNAVNYKIPVPCPLCEEVAKRGPDDQVKCCYCRCTEGCYAIIRAVLGDSDTRFGGTGVYLQDDKDYENCHLVLKWLKTAQKE